MQRGFTQIERILNRILNPINRNDVQIVVSLSSPIHRGKIQFLLSVFLAK